MNTLEDHIRDAVLNNLLNEEELKKLISEIYYPEDIFDNEALKQWALENSN